jgi:hypothetical protein
VKSYNSNGLWLREPEALAAEAIELRDEGARDDLAAIMAAWDAAGVPLCVLLGVGSWGDSGARSANDRGDSIDHRRCAGTSISRDAENAPCFRH